MLSQPLALRLPSPDETREMVQAAAAMAMAVAWAPVQLTLLFWSPLLALSPSRR